MISINLFSADVMINQAKAAGFRGSSFQKIVGVALLALTFLATCYFLCSHCFRHQMTQEILSGTDDEQKPAIKASKAAEEIILSPKHSPHLQQKEQTMMKVEDHPKMPETDLKKEKSQDDLKRQETDLPKTEKVKKPAQKQSMTNWDELEAYARPLLQQPGLEIDIPGKGKVPKGIVQSLLTHRPAILWDDLNRLQEVQCLNQIIRINGWLSAALCSDSFIFKNKTKDALQNGRAPLLGLTKEQFEKVVGWLYGELPDNEKELVECCTYAATLQCSSLMPACIKKLSNIKIAAEISQWTFEPDKVQAVISLYNAVKGPNQDVLKPACEKYFQRAVTTPGKHILEVYQVVKNEPDIVDLLFEGAIKEWKSLNNDPVIELHFTKLLDSNNDVDDYFNYVSVLVEKMKQHGQDPQVTRHFRNIFDHLDDAHVEDLLRIILSRSQEPFDMLVFFTQNVLYAPKAHKVLALILSSASPSGKLQMLLGSWSDDPQFLSGLSDVPLKALIALWQTMIDKKECFAKLKRLFNARPQDIEDILELCLDLDIDFDAFIAETQDEKYQPKLCAAYVLRILESTETTTIKKELIENVLANLNPLRDANDQDGHYLFGAYLAKKCQSEHLDLLLATIPNVGIDPQHIGEGFFMTLLQNVIASSKDRVQKAFEAYWTCWKKFDTFAPALSCLILPEIDSEETLEAAYQAIPQSIDRDKIVKHLKETHLIDDFGVKRTYRVSLPQDVIDRIVI